MINHAKFGSETARRITESWTDGSYRVKVYTYHDKARKIYFSVILECKVETSGMDGICFEKHSPHDDFNRLISQSPATRYSHEKMSTAHDLAVAEVGDLVASLLASAYDEKAEA